MKIQLVSPDFLRWHSLIESLPRWSDDSPEMADLVENVRENGILTPLDVCVSDNGTETPAYHYLVDGRHRHRAALLAGLTEIPVIVRAESEAPTIVLTSLCQRRHFTKGARAYLSFPVLAAMALKGPGGNGTNQHRRKEQSSTQSTIAKSAEILALEMGFSRDLYFQAKTVHEAFSRRPDLREEYESRILAGEIGLGACVAGLAGKESTEGKTRSDRDPETLLRAGFADLRARFSRWEKIEPAARRAIAHDAADTVLQMPADVKQTILRALRASLN